MRSRFHPLRIKDIRKETDDCVSIAFDVPHDAQDAFAFTPGQYLVLKDEINGESVRRSYSICSPQDEAIRVAIKKMPHGIFSTYANDVLAVGDELEVSPPDGTFLIKKEKGIHHVGFAAGSGITPIMSMIHYVLQDDPTAQFTLFYLNKSSQSIIFKRDIEDLKDKYLTRFRAYHIFTREKLEAPVFNGRFSPKKVQSLLQYFIPNKEQAAFYICGPNEMIDAVESGLEQAGIAQEAIHHERFSSPLDHKKAAAERVIVDHHDGDSEVTLILDGEQMQFPLNYDGDNVLDAALSEGADLPFACKGGVCCTCKAKLLSGEVQMVVNYGLEPDEIERGYILTCQAHPTTEKITVSFDE